MNLKEIGEFGLIDKIKSLVNSPSENLIVGIDDDAAAFKLSKDQVSLISSDALIEGIHFNLSYFTFYQLGWRAMAANLSDMAAMAGWPVYATVTLGLPEQLQVDSVIEMYQGMKDLADSYQVSIIGGDTTKSPDRIFISLTIVGQVDRNKLTLRSGAQTGDSIFVTGKLGGSQSGLKILKSQNNQLKDKFVASVEKHLTPKPRIEEAKFLVDNFPVHAMIDISDGLASEINHICKRSKVGAIIHEGQIPLTPETKPVAEYFKNDPFKYVLNGGEDFELLFTVPQEMTAEIQNVFNQRFNLSCTKIGTIRNNSKGIVLKRVNHIQSSIIERGFDHFVNN